LSPSVTKASTSAILKAAELALRRSIIMWRWSNDKNLTLLQLVQFLTCVERHYRHELITLPGQDWIPSFSFPHYMAECHLIWRSEWTICNPRDKECDLTVFSE
jgi:hypothetical protein